MNLPWTCWPEPDSKKLPTTLNLLRFDCSFVHSPPTQTALPLNLMSRLQVYTVDKLSNYRLKILAEPIVIIVKAHVALLLSSCVLFINRFIYISTVILFTFFYSSLHHIVVARFDNLSVANTDMEGDARIQSHGPFYWNLKFCRRK